MSGVWTSNIDALSVIFRRSTDNSVLRGRTDPEVLITRNGPVVHYNRRELKQTPNGGFKFRGGVKCPEGVHMADPGLGP